MLKNITASEIRRMTTDGGGPIKLAVEREGNDTTLRIDQFSSYLLSVIGHRCRQSTACNDTSWVWTPLVVLCCLLEVVSITTEAMLIPEALLMLQSCIFLHFSSLSRTPGSIQAGVGR